MTNDLSKVTFSMQVTREVPLSLIQGLLVGFFEYDISSWFSGIERANLAPEYAMKDFSENGRMQGKDYFHYSQIIPVTEGCSLTLLVDNPNADDPDETIEFILDLPALKKGLEVFASKYPKHWADVLEENDDAITSDVFMQCVVYKEIVYG